MEDNSEKKVRVRYPVGDQDFKSVRDGGYLYVDKTRFIEEMLEQGGKYYFLARPRRFGKSLFLSTLQYFFEGRRELFSGLAVDGIDWDWAGYPVLRIDLSTERYDDPVQLESTIDSLYAKWEKIYGVKDNEGTVSQRFRNIVETAHEKTGLQVVVLVDECDKPLVGNLNNDGGFDAYRSKLAGLYSNFKSCAAHLRMVFITGVSRFSKLSVFSDLNNLKDISFSNDFADICGITEKELLDNFGAGIRKLADEMQVSYEEALNALKRNYDGYRFARKGSDIYNPWSVLNAMQDSAIGNYWNQTGLPTVVAEALKRTHADLESALDSYCREDDLRGLDLLNPDPTALLYQAGYLTIKDYYAPTGSYRLAVPNKEVKTGLYEILMPYYVQCRSGLPNRIVSDMVRGFIEGSPGKALRCMQAYFAGVHFKMKMDNENNFHNAFFLLTDLVGLDAETESATSDGSIDIVVKTDRYIYVVELKYDGSADAALRQIAERRYARKFQFDGRKVFEIGVNFSSKSRCIEDWKILES